MVARNLSQVERQKIADFWTRRARALDRKAADDARRVLTHPFYYYCRNCFTLLAISATPLIGPQPSCEDCRFLIDHALMPPSGAHPTPPMKVNGS